MIYYRLYENIPARSSLGFGPNGGRWNNSGTPLIYASNIVTLSFMELYTIKGPVVANSKWILTTLKVPDIIPMLDIIDLPIDWKKRPHSHSTKNFGTIWANSKKSLCLKVPSARIPLTSYPTEHNLLINPLHPDFGIEITVISEEEVTFEINMDIKI